MFIRRKSFFCVENSRIFVALVEIHAITFFGRNLFIVVERCLTSAIDVENNATGKAL
jgi:hypothetical protein